MTDLIKTLPARLHAVADRLDPAAKTPPCGDDLHTFAQVAAEVRAVARAIHKMLWALGEYPKRNTQQLQAAKVCKGVLALAETASMPDLDAVAEVLSPARKRVAAIAAWHDLLSDFGAEVHVACTYTLVGGWGTFDELGRWTPSPLRDSPSAVDQARHNAENYPALAPLFDHWLDTGPSLTDTMQGMDKAENRVEVPMPWSSIGEAVAVIEKTLPGWAWSISRITNDRHFGTPVGDGFAVTVKSPPGMAVYEKAATLGKAVEQALRRAKYQLSHS